MREIRDRNTEQHWEGNSVNTESQIRTHLFSTCLYTSVQKGSGEAIDFINMILGIDLNSPTFSPGGVDPPLYPKYQLTTP